jgi:glycosyltransferase involved in cell wall biosynthesis
MHWNDVSAPWRVTVPLAALGRAGYAVREGCVLDGAEEVEDADLLVLHRPVGEMSLRLLEAARSRGIRTVVDVDDVFMSGEMPSLVARNWEPDSQPGNGVAHLHAGADSGNDGTPAPQGKVLSQFHECLRLADAVTVSTAPLADVYRTFNPHIYVLPNCYDDTDPVWQWRAPPRSEVHIGFAGSSSHGDNLQLLSGALEPVLLRHCKTRVVEAGDPYLVTQIEAPAQQLVHLGSVSFRGFPLVLHQMDIVLAPLADTLFMRSKSNIRCLTAGLAGLPVVASPVGDYLEYVEHGVNGFLADSPEDWTDYVERLVEDPELRRAMGAANRQRAGAYAISANCHRWTRVYEEVLRRHRCA